MDQAHILKVAKDSCESWLILIVYSEEGFKNFKIKVILEKQYYN